MILETPKAEIIRSALISQKYNFSDLLNKEEAEILSTDQDKKNIEEEKKKNLDSKQSDFFMVSGFLLAFDWIGEWRNQRRRVHLWQM